VAKTLEAQTDLVRQLQARTVKRQYQALVWGHPAALGKGGLIDAPIGRHPTQRVKMAVVKQLSQGREARTNYTVIESFTHCDLVECRLETGRTHQIRVHMTHLGHPLIGDMTYGRSNAPADAHPALAAFPRQALHAWRLGLVHPATGVDMVWETSLAADFVELLAQLRGERA
jgi:23S rRNA pseudouridine1911/1915/1917 synthase